MLTPDEFTDVLNTKLLEAGASQNLIDEIKKTPIQLFNKYDEENNSDIEILNNKINNIIEFEQYERNDLKKVLEFSITILKTKY